MTVTVRGTDGYRADFTDSDLDGTIDTPRIPKGASAVTDLTTKAVKTFVFTFQ